MGLAIGIIAFTPGAWPRYHGSVRATLHCDRADGPTTLAMLTDGRLAVLSSQHQRNRTHITIFDPSASQLPVSLDGETDGTLIGPAVADETGVTFLGTARGVTRPIGVRFTEMARGPSRALGDARP